MKKELLMISLASSFAFSQNDLPNVENISAVLGDEIKKYVVSLTWDEYYDPCVSNFIGDFESEVERDTFYVSKRYPIGHLIDETEWEEFKWTVGRTCKEVN